MAFKILLIDRISPRGLEKFDPSQYSLLTECKDPDAILIRSSKLNEKQIPTSVKVVGRAGVGVNNIPIPELTARGVPVLNTPGANANAVKELVITGMLLASRNIYNALQYTQGLCGDDETITYEVEKNKKQFLGFELPGKTLGIVGLGKIGTKVANAAISLGMKAIGYDPAITIQNAWELSSEVKHAQSMRDILQHSDFITIHVPLNENTANFINDKTIAQMKKTAVLLNFARSEVVDNQALIQALRENKIRNYVCDFPSQALKTHPAVICLPHLGASTQESEENCAIMIAEQIQKFLEYGYIQNSVNFPSVELSPTENYRIVIINKNIPNMVAQISSILSQANINIIDMINKSRNDIAYTILDVNQKINNKILNCIQSINGVIQTRVIDFQLPSVEIPEPSLQRE